MAGTIRVGGASAITITTIVTNTSSTNANDGSIIANAAGGTPPYSYQFSNGVFDSAANNLSVGCYSITVSDGNNCTVSKDTICVQVATGIDNISINKVGVSPNPATDIIIVDFADATNIPNELCLIDALGRTALHMNVARKQQVQLDVTTLVTGPNILVASCNGKLISRLPIMINSM